MDPRPIVDKSNGEMLSSPNTTTRSSSGAAAAMQGKAGGVRFPGEDDGRSLAEMAQRDLKATLQLLAERAQYITGATGAAIALRDQDEMVCRASAGRSAPEVGALLQVNSGLSGESVRTRQTLRCDDAFVDPRVNRAGCEALGIRSVVVMPLIRGEEVIGVFELFSDKPHIFENRDLAALERMGTMVHTALEHSTAALGFPPMLGEVIQPVRAPQPGALPAPAREKAATAGVEPRANKADTGHVPENGSGPSAAAGRGLAFHGKMLAPATSTPAYGSPVPGKSEAVRASGSDSIPAAPVEDDDVLETEIPTAPQSRNAPTQVHPAPARASFESLLANSDAEPILSDVSPYRDIVAAAGFANLEAVETPEDGEAPKPLSVPPAAVASLKKCRQCGFPVSEGRRLCIDCERKSKTGDSAATATFATRRTALAEVDSVPHNGIGSHAPSFMTGADQASWLSTHKFTVIAMVLAGVGIAVLVALR